MVARTLTKLTVRQPFILFSPSYKSLINLSIHLFSHSSPVSLYKCELLGVYSGKADCSLCESLSSAYQCAYCGGGCSFKDTCDPEAISICPPPRIDLMHPLSGPVEGGTILTIEGSNLGSSIEQLRNKISIGSSTCEPIQASSSVKVVCKTGPSFNASGHSANVVVANSAGLTFSQEKFHFKVSIGFLFSSQVYSCAN